MYLGNKHWFIPFGYKFKHRFIIFYSMKVPEIDKYEQLTKY